MALLTSVKWPCALLKSADVLLYLARAKHARGRFCTRRKNKPISKFGRSYGSLSNNKMTEEVYLWVYVCKNPARIDYDNNNNNNNKNNNNKLKMETTLY